VRIKYKETDEFIASEKLIISYKFLLNNEAIGIKDINDIISRRIISILIFEILQ